MARTTATEVSQNRRLGNVEILRFISAAMIVALHVEILFAPYLNLSAATSAFLEMRLSAGVDIFFVISGFVIAMNIQRSETTPARFIKARFARIIPSYWLLSLATVPLALIFGVGGDTAPAVLPHLASSLFFINDKVGFPFPMLGPGWSLNLEIFFYVLVFLVMLWPQLRRHTLLISSIVIAGFAYLGSHYQSDGQPLPSGENPIVIDFIFGFLAFKLWPKIQGNRTLGWLFAAAAIGALGAANLYPEFAKRWMYLGVPAFLAFLAALSFPNLTSPRLAKLGFSSYSIYLTQWFVITAAQAALQKLHPGLALSAVGFILLIPFTIACGYMYSTLIDSRLYAWARRLAKL